MSGVALRQLGKYEVRGIIGRGAVGVVYEAWDPIMARTVAIKTLPLVDMDDEGKEQYERFKREAQAAARLHHPNIVSAFDYGETESSAYIVMEFLAGPSLKALLAKREPLGLPEAARIMHSLLTGLQHSHQRGVVHRDIKPGNVVFSADGEVKITDFGVAHLESSGMTRAGSVIGTPAYMAPEQVLGEAVDARTDVYAAGVVFYEMLTGRRPFDGSTASIMHKIVHADAPQPSHLAPTVSTGIDAIIAKAIEKEPADRYQTAAAFADALRGELARAPIIATPDDSDSTVATRRPPAVPVASPPAAPPPVAPAPPATAAGGRRLWPLAAIGAVVALGAGAWLALQPGAPRSTAPSTVASAPPRAEPVPAPAPPATPAPPAAQPPAPASAAPDPVRQQVEAIITSAPCAFVSVDLPSGGAVRLRGVSGLGETSELEIQAALQRAIQMAVPAASVTWSMRRIDGPYCPVLDLLRPLGKGSAVTLSLPADRSRLTDGDSVRLAVEAPGPPAHLTLDRFASDGTVRHLHAGPTDGSHPYAARAWQAGKPYGEQLITALVTSDALFTQPRPEHEPAAAYLQDLQAALARTRDRDGRLAAGVLPIDVVPR